MVIIVVTFTLFSALMGTLELAVSQTQTVEVFHSDHVFIVLSSWTLEEGWFWVRLGAETLRSGLRTVRVLLLSGAQ